MSKWVKFGEQHVLNPDKIKYCYIDDDKESITIIFDDGQKLVLNPEDKVETVKDWKDILDTFEIDPPYWVYEIIHGLNIRDIEGL